MVELVKVPPMISASHIGAASVPAGPLLIQMGRAAEDSPSVWGPGVHVEDQV